MARFHPDHDHAERNDDHFTEKNPHSHSHNHDEESIRESDDSASYKVHEEGPGWKKREGTGHDHDSTRALMVHVFGDTVRPLSFMSV